VYAAETVSYEKKPYHAECFKCSNCVKKISPSGAAMFEEKLFCSKCFADGGYRQKQVATASKTPAAVGSSAPSKFGGGGNKCVKCDKTVYAAETVSFEKAAITQNALNAILVPRSFNLQVELPCLKRYCYA